MGTHKTYQGTFKPTNPSKYKGNVRLIVYRSSWEKVFMKYCDSSASVLEWSSEERIIPYVSPVDQKVHRYYPDFWVKVKKPDGDVQELLVEIKPEKYTKEPKPRTTPKRKKPSASYLKEMKGYSVNKAKWEAAERFCNKNNMKFLIMTENDIFGTKKK